MSDNKFSHNQVDAGDDSAELFADQEIQRILMKREASTNGIGDISKALRNNTFVGSNLKNEIVELEENMRQLLSEGRYGYKFIEGTLMSLGYPLDEIRNVFERLTGVSVEKWMNVDQIYDVPGSIPGINYGWGASKNSAYDFYFIMPFKCGYSLFGQKGDLQRDEVDYSDTLSKAIETLKSKVKEAVIWDKPIDAKTLGEFPKSNFTLPTVFALSANEKFNSLDKYLYNNIDRLDLGSIEKIIVRAKLNNNISEDEFQILKKDYIDIKADELEEAEPNKREEKEEKDANAELKDIMNTEEENALSKSVEEELDETTPTEYFKNSVDETKYETLPAIVVDKIYSYIDYKNESLDTFEIIIKGFKYTSIDVIEDFQNTISIDDQQSFFDANALITVILVIKNMALPQDQQEKNALMVFSVVKSDIVTADYCKGSDNKMYSLTNEGLSKLYM